MMPRGVAGDHCLPQHNQREYDGIILPAKVVMKEHGDL